MNAIVYPGADYRQLSGKSTSLLTPLVINIHTMVGTLAGSEAWFTPTGRPYSHFGVGGSGAVRQWQDLRYRAASDLSGNAFCISIECEDSSILFSKWTGSDVPAFTAKQYAALDNLIDWLCTRFAISRRLLKNSCERNGISYHRLGIDPWREPDCTYFSSKTGKVCPGERRIAQIRSLVLGEASVPKEWDEMATQAEVEASFEKVLRRVLNEGTGPGQKAWAGTSRATLATVQGNTNKLNALAGAVAALDSVDETTVAALMLKVLTPEAIAAAIDGSVAAEVLDLLRERLAT